MIGKVAHQTFQLFTDKNLLGYWTARAIISSLLFLFGILLRNAGFVNDKVVIAWIVVGLTQGVMLIGLDKMLKRRGAKLHFRMTQVLAVVSVCSAVTMMFRGVSLELFSLTTIAMMPLIRELTHAGMLHLRDRTDWVLGKNVAFIYANESGKALGAAFVVLLGYFSSIGDTYLAGFIAALLLVCLAYTVLQQTDIEKDAFDPAEKIGRIGRRYVWLNMAHNAAFSASKSILSLVLFDVVANRGRVEDVILMIAATLSIVMVFGIIAMQAVGGRLENLMSRIPRLGMMTMSVALLAGVVAFGAGGTLAAMSTESPQALTIISYAIALSIGGLMAFGGLFSLGTMKFLDKAFHDNLNLRKSTLHYCWIVGAFSPSVVLFGYLVLDWYLPTIEAGMMALVAILLLEGVCVLLAHRMSVEVNGKAAEAVPQATS